MQSGDKVYYRGQGVDDVWRWYPAKITWIDEPTLLDERLATLEPEDPEAPMLFQYASRLGRLEDCGPDLWDGRRETRVKSNVS